MRKFLVTGGHGFLGQHIVALLKSKGYDVFAPHSSVYNLLDKSQARDLIKDVSPDCIIHAAARVGGIKANSDNGAGFLFANATMGLNMIEESVRCGVPKFVQIGTACSYPASAPLPLKESDIWNGYPEPTNAAYGLAKRLLLAQIQANREQYNFNGIYLIFANLYGPGDNFDLETSHTIPAVIRKIHEAKSRNEKVVTFWGSGKATRDFLYVEDAAEGIVKMAEEYNGAGPVNIATGREYEISSVIEMIASLMDYDGEIVFANSGLDGQKRRVLDTYYARTLGFTSKTNLLRGLNKTIAWYLKGRA